MGGGWWWGLGLRRLREFGVGVGVGSGLPTTVRYTPRLDTYYTTVCMYIPRYILHLFYSTLYIHTVR